MFFLDFTYLLLFKIYSIYYNEESAASSGSGIVGGLLAFNGMSLLLFLSAFFDLNIEFDIVYAIVLFLVFQIFSYIRFFYIKKCSIVEIEIKWVKKSKSYRNIFKYFFAFYVLFSFLSMFGLAIYAHSRS